MKDDKEIRYAIFAIALEVGLTIKCNDYEDKITGYMLDFIAGGLSADLAQDVWNQGSRHRK